MQSIEQMLWPERREKDAVLGDKVPGFIQRTTARTFVGVPSDQLPGWVMWVVRKLRPQWVDVYGDLSVGSDSARHAGQCADQSRTGAGRRGFLRADLAFHQTRAIRLPPVLRLLVVAG